ncbi:unnamed protein product [Blepharisma stoltei]|uniref:Uncharacterized protein n=1 Tax=Blepharisma stoltei TaxID=1481888 RepID=A0AAU9K8Q4_9CILI|nr:unnamed protein product [Blepharisma stoltei]
MRAMNKEDKRNLPLILSRNCSRISAISHKREHACRRSADLSNRNKSDDSIRNLFCKSRLANREGSMENYQGPIGLSARIEFFETFKNLDKYKEQIKQHHMESSPNIAFLEKCEKEKIWPKPIGIVKRRGTSNEFDLRNMGVGDKYANALSKGLKSLKSVEKLNLRNNRLSDSGSIKILSRMNGSSLKDLNLANNKLGNKPIEKLIELINNPKSCLKKLNLEGTELNYQGLEILVDSLCDNSKIKVLNLAKNKLGENAGFLIGKLLQSNISIKKLDLHWNEIREEGAVKLFEGLTYNDTLLELDLSWNSIGRSTADDITIKIGNLLGNQRELRHLDLSYNYLTQQECLNIGEGLKKNHTLLGIHLQGNECQVDSKGFIRKRKIDPKLETGHLTQRIFDHDSLLAKNHCEDNSNCWLCEAWVEVNFIWTNSIVTARNEPIFLHLDIDDYEPELIPVDYMGFYSVARMVPPRDILFFFSHGETPVICEEWEIVKLCEPIENVIEYSEGIQIRLNVTTVNKILPKGPMCKLNDLPETKPRIEKEVYNKKTIEEPPKYLWKIETSSIFKDIAPETEEFIDKCFDFDWGFTKIDTFFKSTEDMESCKRLLRRYYPLIRNTYKILSAISGNEIFSMGINAFFDFLNQCGTFDSYYSAADVGVNWNATLSSKIKNQTYNPGNALIRYEFLEVLARVAYDKFFKSKLAKTVTEAVEKLLKNEFEPLMKNYMAGDGWRKKLLTEECENIVKLYKPCLEQLFEKFSKKKTLPGQAPFVSIEEFRELCILGGFQTGSLMIRDFDVSYAYSMRPQIDEVYNKKHMEMNFAEFVEAIARVADLANLQIAHNEELAKKDPDKVPLQIKLKYALMHLSNIFEMSPTKRIANRLFVRRKTRRSLTMGFDPKDIRESSARSSIGKSEIKDIRESSARSSLGKSEAKDIRDSSARSSMLL